MPRSDKQNERMMAVVFNDDGNAMSPLCDITLCPTSNAMESI